MSGKFNSLRDAVAHRASLDPGGDTIGSVQDHGTCSTFVKDLYGKHAIVTEDSQGFVTVEWFNAYIEVDGQTICRSAEAGNRWLEIYDAYNEWSAIYNEEEDE